MNITDADILIGRAVRSQTSGWGANRSTLRPSEEQTRDICDEQAAVLRLFRAEAANVLEWLFMVVASLSEDKVKVPPRTMFETWDLTLAHVVTTVEAQFETDRVEMQAEYDHDPAGFTPYYSRCVVENGKVLDPWGPAISGPVRWFLGNVTLVGIRLVQKAVEDAVTDAVTDNLSAWALGSKDNDPRKIASETFEKGMEILDKDIRAHLAGSVAA